MSTRAPKGEEGPPKSQAVENKISDVSGLDGKDQPSKSSEASEASVPGNSMESKRNRTGDEVQQGANARTQPRKPVGKRSQGRKRAHRAGTALAPDGVINPYASSARPNGGRVERPAPRVAPEDAGSRATLADAQPGTRSGADRIGRQPQAHSLPHVGGSDPGRGRTQRTATNPPIRSRSPRARAVPGVGTVPLQGGQDQRSERAGKGPGDGVGTNTVGRKPVPPLRGPPASGAAQGMRVSRTARARLQNEADPSSARHTYGAKRDNQLDAVARNKSSFSHNPRASRASQNTALQREAFSSEAETLLKEIEKTKRRLGRLDEEATRQKKRWRELYSETRRRSQRHVSMEKKTRLPQADVALNEYQQHMSKREEAERRRRMLKAESTHHARPGVRSLAALDPATEDFAPLILAQELSAMGAQRGDRGAPYVPVVRAGFIGRLEKDAHRKEQELSVAQATVGRLREEINDKRRIAMRLQAVLADLETKRKKADDDAAVVVQRIEEVKEEVVIAKEEAAEARETAEKDELGIAMQVRELEDQIEAIARTAGAGPRGRVHVHALQTSPSASKVGKHGDVVMRRVGGGAVVEVKKAIPPHIKRAREAREGAGNKARPAQQATKRPIGMSSGTANAVVRALQRPAKDPIPRGGSDSPSSFDAAAEDGHRAPSSSTTVLIATEVQDVVKGKFDARPTSYASNHTSSQSGKVPFANSPSDAATNANSAMLASPARARTSARRRGSAYERRSSTSGGRGTESSTKGGSPRRAPRSPRKRSIDDEIMVALGLRAETPVSKQVDPDTPRPKTSHDIRDDAEAASKHVLEDARASPVAPVRSQQRGGSARHPRQPRVNLEILPGATRVDSPEGLDQQEEEGEANSGRWSPTDAVDMKRKRKPTLSIYVAGSSAASKSKEGEVDSPLARFDEETGDQPADVPTPLPPPASGTTQSGQRSRRPNFAHQHSGSALGMPTVTVPSPSDETSGQEAREAGPLAARLVRASTGQKSAPEETSVTPSVGEEEPAPAPQAGHLGLEEEARLRSAHARYMWKIAAQKIKLMRDKVTIRRAKAMWAQISLETNEKSASKFIETFVTAEQRNLSLVQQYSALTLELSQLQSRGKALADDVDDSKAKGEESSAARRSFLERLQESHRQMEVETAILQAQLGTAQSKLEEITQPTYAMFSQLLGNMALVDPTVNTLMASGPSVLTLPDMLGEVEQRVAEMVQVISALDPEIIEKVDRPPTPPPKEEIESPVALLRRGQSSRRRLTATSRNGSEKNTPRPNVGTPLSAPPRELELPAPAPAPAPAVGQASTLPAHISDGPQPDSSSFYTGQMLEATDVSTLIGKPASRKGGTTALARRTSQPSIRPPNTAELDDGDVHTEDQVAFENGLASRSGNSRPQSHQGVVVEPFDELWRRAAEYARIQGFVRFRLKARARAAKHRVAEKKADSVVEEEKKASAKSVEETDNKDQVSRKLGQPSASSASLSRQPSVTLGSSGAARRRALRKRRSKMDDAAPVGALEQLDAADDAAISRARTAHKQQAKDFHRKAAVRASARPADSVESRPSATETYLKASRSPMSRSRMVDHLNTPPPMLRRLSGAGLAPTETPRTTFSGQDDEPTDFGHSTFGAASQRRTGPSTDAGPAIVRPSVVYNTNTDHAR